MGTCIYIIKDAYITGKPFWEVHLHYTNGPGECFDIILGVRSSEDAARDMAGNFINLISDKSQIKVIKDKTAIEYVSMPYKHKAKKNNKEEV